MTKHFDMESIKTQLDQFKDAVKLMPEIEKMMGLIDKFDSAAFEKLNRMSGTSMDIPKQAGKRALEMEAAEAEVRSHLEPAPVVMQKAPVVDSPVGSLDGALHKEVAERVVRYYFRKEVHKLEYIRLSEAECVFKTHLYHVRCVPWYCDVDGHTKTQIFVASHDKVVSKLSESVRDTITCVVNAVLGMFEEKLLSL